MIERRPWVAALLLASLAAGLFARFHGLGESALAIDEYYFVRSVGFVLDTGVPALPSGGYYLRGIPLQYLTAASVWIFGETGFGWRLPAVLFSLACVPLAYVYARRFASREVAAAVACALLVSSWQIEFARFARMYSLFQFSTLWFLIALDDAVFRNRRRALPYGLALLATASHQLGVLLAPLLLLPLFSGARSRGQRLRLGAGAVVGMALCFGGMQVIAGAMDWGVPPRFPEGWSYQGPPDYSLPVLPFAGGGGIEAALVLAVLGLAVLRGGPRSWRASDGWLLALLLACAAHQLALAAAVLAILLLRYGGEPWSRDPRRTAWLLGMCGALVLGWLGWALWDSGWTARVPDGDRGLPFALARAFFGWPNWIDPLAVAWGKQLPGVGLLAVLALAFLAFVHARDPLPRLLRHPAAVLGYFLVCFGLVAPSFPNVRYAFHVYPVLLTAIALAIGAALSRLGRLPDSPTAVATIFLAAFAVADDFHPAHIAGVSTNEVRFRTGDFERFYRTWYPRRDVRGPAGFLMSVEGPIVVENEPTASFYVRRPHAVYLRRDSHFFATHSRRQGSWDRWAEQPLLGTPAELREFVGASPFFWLLRPTRESEQHLALATLGDGVRARRFQLGADGRVEVVQVDWGAAP
jgi:hypothetical protein